MAEINQNRASLEGSEDSDEYEPRTEEDSIVANSPDIISEIASEVAEVEADDQYGYEARNLMLR